jgi:hypothetical protein
LGVVQAGERIDSLDFDDYLIGNHQVDAIPGIQSGAFIDNRHRHLTPDCKPAELKFKRQEMFICRFQQTRP